MSAEYQGGDAAVVSTVQCPASSEFKEPRRCDPPHHSETQQSQLSAPVSEDDCSIDKSNLEQRYHENMIDASDLPEPDDWRRERSSSSLGSNSYGEMLWDSNKAHDAAEQVELLESVVPNDRREAALELMHGNGYHTNGILEKTMQQEPKHGLNWSPATKRAFSNSIDRRKDFTAVSKRLKSKAGDCQAYYYSHFKRTSEYRAMKRDGKMQMKTRSSIGRSNSSSEGSSSSRLFSDECAMCDEDVGTLIKCDICLRVFHLHCVELDAPPEGTWFCEEC